MDSTPVTGKRLTPKEATEALKDRLTAYDEKVKEDGFEAVKEQLILEPIITQYDLRLRALRDAKPLLVGMFGIAPPTVSNLITVAEYLLNGLPGLRQPK